MPDIDLEPLLAAPVSNNHAVLRLVGGPIVPMDSQRGDVNYLCGHRAAVLVKQVGAEVRFPTSPPGMTFCCWKCGKHSLHRMSRETRDAVERGEL